MTYEMLSVDGKDTSGNPVTSEPAKVEPTPEEITPVSPVETPATTETPGIKEDTPETPAEPETPELYWGDVPITVDLPEEISAAFTEKGIDGKAVLAELFTKDGKFELSSETRGKLDEAFGKSLVDGYLGLYKQQNTMSIEKFQQEQAQIQETVKANSAECDTLVQGAGGWDKLSDWAVANMDEKQLDAFNAVMNLPVEHWVAQRTVIEALVGKMGDGQSPLKLLTDDMPAGTGAPEGLPSSLTKEQFYEQMYTDKYRNDKGYRNQIDNIRRQSQKAGIK